jgi:hypothetical protein
MMEDSYEISIIDYLAKEFTKNLLNNPSIIEDKIRESIKDIVYDKKQVMEKPIPPPTKILIEGVNPKKQNIRIISNVPTEDRTFLQEGVLPKPKKERAKKAIPDPPTPPASRFLKEGKEPEKPKNLND